MKVLVAGGAGYIGSITTSRLIESGHGVVVLDNLSRGYMEAVHPGAVFVEGDISDPSAVSEACSHGVDMAMHFAAYIEAGESVYSPAKYYANNVACTVSFLDNLKANGVNKLVFSSSAAVYGDSKTNPIAETNSLMPLNPYGRTKLMNEQILKDYDEAYGMKSVSLRYFNAGGAYMSLGESHNPETHLIPRMLDAALNDQEAEIYGIDYNTRDGSCVRDYIHVRDLAEAHVLAGNYLIEAGKSETLNLGSGSGYTVLEVAKTIGDITGKNIPLKICERRPGDCATLVASSSKAKKVLGWSPRATLGEIIQSAHEWKMAFPQGYTE